MRIVDVHSHWGTKRGYVLRTDAALAQQSKTWRSEPKYDTEDGMAQYLRANRVRAILDFGFTKKMGRIGLGMGLPSSKRLVEQMGGEIDVRSIEGQGTTVRLTVPRTCERDDSAPMAGA